MRVSARVKCVSLPSTDQFKMVLKCQIKIAHVSKVANSRSKTRARPSSSKGICCVEDTERKGGIRGVIESVTSLLQKGRF